MRLRHQHHTCFPWTMPRGIPAPSVVHGNGAKACPTISVNPVGIGMAQRPEIFSDSRSTPDDQRHAPASGSPVVAPHGVLLPMHRRMKGAEGVTIDRARVTVPGSPPVAVLSLPPSMGSIKTTNRRLRDMPCEQPVPGKNHHIKRHLFFFFERVGEDKQGTSSIRTPASSLERTIARCAGCFWEISVTYRPRWGATRAEKRGTRRLGRLPMRNVSRQGAARQDKVANSCIYNIHHLAPVDESPAFA